MKIRYIFAVWLIFTVTVFGKSDTESPGCLTAEIEYFAVFMEGKKVGHAIQSRTVADGKVTTSEKVSITISRAAIPVTINMTETNIETIDGKPLGFEVISDLGIITMKSVGTVDEQGKVNVITTSMGSEQKSTMQWPSGAVMAEGLLQISLKKGLNEGSTYTVRIFSPSIMQALDTQIHVGPKQTVDLLGRVVSLTEVTTTYTIPGAGEIVSTSYVDETLKVQKSVAPIAGIQVEMVACAKEFALSQNDVFEVVDKMFLASPEPLVPDLIGDVRSAKSISYILSTTGEANNLTIPSNDNQKVQPARGGDAGKIIVTVEPAIAPAGATFPYKGQNKMILEATKPSRFLQSDHKEIIELAHRAIDGTKDTAEAIRKIEAFVADYIEDRNLSIGYASAVEVAASKQGDCTEHAVLAAALCRAVGIPAQVVTGIAYVKEFASVKDTFGGHAWVQAYIGEDSGKWVGLDAAFKGSGRGGYGPGHITLAVGNGNPEDLLNLATTLGRFKIDKVLVKK